MWELILHMAYHIDFQIIHSLWRLMFFYFGPILQFLLHTPLCQQRLLHLSTSVSGYFRLRVHTSFLRKSRLFPIYGIEIFPCQLVSVFDLIVNSLLLCF